MTTHYLTIDAMHRKMGGILSSLEDFTLSDGDAVDPEIILTNPNISLYCFDDATARAIFVELSPNVDLGSASFVYQTLYDQAQRLIAMPYETFKQVARNLPEVQHLIPVYITGRSGSTLLSHVFNALDDVLNLAEPDVATQFIHMRRADGSRDAELRDLLDCTMRMLFKPTPFKTPTTCSVKFRNQGLLAMDLYQATYPDAKNLFLYRDAIGFITSFYRIFTSMGMPYAWTVSDFLADYGTMMGRDMSYLIEYLDPGTDPIPMPQQLALWWILVIELYLEQYATGIPVLAVRYADLNASQEQVVSGIFDYCGLPKERVKETLGVFGRDSQAGTPLARENPTEGNKLRLTEEEQAAVTRILARHPVIQSSDYIVPGTLKV